MSQPPKLRDYQAAAKSETKKQLSAGFKRIILCLATGGGKTNVAADMIAGALQRGNKVLFLAHRRELITQARDRLLQFGIVAGVVMGKQRYAGDSVNVASVATLVRRPDEWPEANIVVVDECHHFVLGKAKDDAKVVASADTDEGVEADLKKGTMYKQVFEHYKDKAVIIGLTATPVRLDGKLLNDVFEVLVLPKIGDEEVNLNWLQDNGYLVNARYFAGREKPDISGLAVSSTTGDFSTKALYKRLDEKRLYDDVVKHWQQRAEGMSTVCFNVNVEHSQHMVEQFVAAGIAAEHLDGTTPDAQRADIIERFKNRETLVLCNVGIVTEGVDIPGIECVIMNRPTESVSLWLQVIGRALRPVYAPGWDLSTVDGRLGAILWSDKPNAVILDHGTNCMRLGFAEDKREWSLTVKKKKKGKAPVSECPEAFGGCGAMLQGFPMRCKYCDFEIREVDETPAPPAKGEFAEVMPSHLNKWTGDMSIAELEEFRAFKKSSVNWVVHQLKHRAKLQTLKNRDLDETETFQDLLTQYADLEIGKKKQYKTGWIFRTMQQFANPTNAQASDNE